MESVLGTYVRGSNFRNDNFPETKAMCPWFLRTGVCSWYLSNKLKEHGVCPWYLCNKIEGKKLCISGNHRHVSIVPKEMGLFLVPK